MHTLSLAVFLATTVATIASAEPLQAVIWGGGTTVEQAEASLRTLESRRASGLALARFAAGFPSVEKSADVPGLKPGFVVVLLGYCPAAEAPAALEWLRGIEPGVYARPVTSEPAASCPSLEKGWKAGGSAESKGRGRRLAAALFLKQGPVIADEYRVVVTQREASGGAARETTVAREALESELVDNGHCVPTLAAKGERLVVSLACEKPGCTTPERVWGEATFTAGAEGPKLEVSETRRVPGECD